MPLSISQLLAAVGDENITFQTLSTDVSNITKGKNEARVTFCTSLEHGNSLMQEAAGVKDSKFVGLIVWVPRALLPEEMK